jgi:hypothetical protein
MTKITGKSAINPTNIQAALKEAGGEDVSTARRATLNKFLRVALKESTKQAGQLPGIQTALNDLATSVAPQRFVGVPMPRKIADDVSTMRIDGPVAFTLKSKKGGANYIETAPAFRAFGPKTMGASRSVVATDNKLGGKDLSFGVRNISGAKWLENKSLDAILPKKDPRRATLEAKGFDLKEPRNLLVIVGAGDKEPTILMAGAGWSDADVDPTTSGGPGRMMRMPVSRDRQGVTAICSEVQFIEFKEGSGGQMMMKKPVVYLYPTTVSSISVQVKVDGSFTTCYPRMHTTNTWNVKASPNGEIFDPRTEKRFPYLFWEATRTTKMSIDLAQAHCVSGADCERFLEDAAKAYAFNDKERTDFVTFWLPVMEHNKFNVVQFLSDSDYSRYADMTVTPKPDQTIRMFMIFQASASAISVGQPTMTAMQRGNGFCVVEWGGANLDEHVNA